MSRPLTRYDRKRVAKSDPLPVRRKGEEAPPPIGAAALTFWLYFLGIGLFGGFGAWAAVSTIQGAVVAGGTFEVEGRLRVVDHLEGGIVSEIFVEDGERVERGDVILRLDPSRLEAQNRILESQLAAALARYARLSAEAQGAEELIIPSELAELLQKEASFDGILAAQKAVFETNRGSDGGQIAIYQDRIDQMENRLTGIDARISTYREQVELVQADVERLEQLLSRGLTRRAPVTRRQEELVILHGRIADADSEKEDVLEQIAEQEQMQLQIARERKRSIANELQSVSQTVVDLRERIAATRDVIARTSVTAPESGTIMGMEINTVGAVIEPGQRLLEIVPADSDYIIEARVATSDIDEIAVGGETRVRLSSYSFRKVAPVEGRVSRISPDAIFDAATGDRYYRIEVELAQADLLTRNDIVPVPGMPVQVMVATKEQTILTHLLDPVLGGLETAFVEGE